MTTRRPTAISIHDKGNMVGNRMPIAETKPPHLCLPFGLLRASATKDGSHQRAQIPNSSLGHARSLFLSVGM
jgi:hypothetical protein